MSSTAAPSRVWQGPLERIDEYRWRIPASYDPGMRVPGLVFADEKLLADIRKDEALQQVANVAHLPGIVGHSMAMPDIHWGYGFPIGGVAATDPLEGGVVSPGGVGFDINCGVRLMRTNLTLDDVQPRLRELVRRLFETIPTGVGMSGALTVSREEHRDVMRRGSQWVIEAKGCGTPDDVEHTESHGAIDGADPDTVSSRALQRGSDQLGTLGSGNHFLEVQAVDTIFDEEAARAFGLRAGSVTVMLHSGSRGFGYQICDDYLDVIGPAMRKYGITVPDRQLACVPVDSDEGRRYLGAMRCAANYAWANRQCLMQLARRAFERVFGKAWQELGLALIYDVAHNIAKFERHQVDGKERMVCVHRKGATRAFPPHHPEIPADYQDVGQPVIIPGDMGRYSYLLAGTDGAMQHTFGTVCHGAGRTMSRTQAVREAAGRSIEKELEAQGIIVMGRGRRGIAEEQPKAYKDVNDVVQVVHGAGLAKRVARMRPLGVIKG